jgi:hypothetical protein
MASSLDHFDGSRYFSEHESVDGVSTNERVCSCFLEDLARGALVAFNVQRSHLQTTPLRDAYVLRDAHVLRVAYALRDARALSSPLEAADGVSQPWATLTTNSGKPLNSSILPGRVVSSTPIVCRMGAQESRRFQHHLAISRRCSVLRRHQHHY